MWHEMEQVDGARTRVRSITAMTALALAALTVAGCGASTSTSTATSSDAASPAVDAALAALLPAKIKSRGMLVIATDASYAPNEFFAADNTTIQGMDVDLGTALGEVLGVKVKFVNAGFDTILVALGTRYDIAMSSFNDTKAREQQVDMVTYFKAGAGFMVKTGTNQGLTSLAALCGRHVAVEKGTTQLDDVTAQTAKCTAAGEGAIDIQAYPDQNGANLALVSGRADVALADAPVNAYAAKQSNGTLQVIGEPYATLPYGIPVPKIAAYVGLDKAILGALQKLQADGKYLTILEKWGVQGGAITNFAIDGAIS